MSLNKFQFLGRLVKDPEMKELDGNKTVTRMTVAVDRKTKEKQTDFFNVTAWDKLGKVCGENLTKGREVYLEGRVQNRTYEKDGVTQYVTDFVATEMSFVGSKGESVKKNDNSEADNSVTEDELESAPF